MSCEFVLRRDSEHGPIGFADCRGRSGDGSNPWPDGADRHRILGRRRKNGRRCGERQAPWLDHHGFGQHQRARAVQFSTGPARPRCYDITMRAVGYTLKPTTATIQSDGSTQLDLKLAKAAPNVLALQLTNSEWMQSAPGTPAQKMALLACLDCHGLQRPFFSKDKAPEMAITVQRMRAHTPNASPNFPFFLQNANEILSGPPAKGAGGLRRLHRFDQSQFRRDVAVPTKNAATADRQINPGHHHDLRSS